MLCILYTCQACQAQFCALFLGFDGGGDSFCTTGGSFPPFGEEDMSHSRVRKDNAGAQEIQCERRGLCLLQAPDSAQMTGPGALAWQV